MARSLTGSPADSGRRVAVLLVIALLALGACSGSDATAPSTTVGAVTTSPPAPTTTSTAQPTTTSTSGIPKSTERFSIPVGDAGVTYLVEGDPPSGPSSFAVLPDASVMIADTMALTRGEPRLLHFDRTGEPLGVISLVDAEVAAIVDVVASGGGVAVLDIYAGMDRYRVLYLSLDGTVESVLDLPAGYHLEDGLTGLRSDDQGVLLEFQFGVRYARLGDSGVGEVGVLPVFDGKELEITELGGRRSEVRFGEVSWIIERSTDLGGVTLVGVGPVGTLVVVVDEVDTSGPAIAVLRRVQRYSADGLLLSESQRDAGEHYVDIAKPLELGANGEVIYLLARPDTLEIVPLDRP